MKNIIIPRIGHSYDIHQLSEGRKLYLGGIHIPHEKGLVGHSDADCLLHAIAESLLGALALGDLGSHFPDNDEKYKNIDSKILLKEVYNKIKSLGYSIGNIDCMVYLELPKLNPHILNIRTCISQILECSIDNVSIKATTFEKLGPIGQQEAIAAECVCLLYND